MTPAPIPQYRPTPLPASIVRNMDSMQYRALAAGTRSLDSLLKGH